MRGGSEEVLVLVGGIGLLRGMTVDLDLLIKSSHLSSKSGRDFWSKFKAEASFEIRGVRRDFGSEFFRGICEGA